MADNCEISQDQRLAQIERFIHAVMFDVLHCFLIEEIEAERIFIPLDLAEQTVAQQYPFLLGNLAFEDRFLNPRAVVLARLCHAPETSLSGFVDS